MLQIPSGLQEWEDSLYSATPHQYAYIGTQRHNATQSSFRRIVKQWVRLFTALPATVDAEYEPLSSLFYARVVIRAFICTSAEVTERPQFT
jgi:hypothetical protein